MEIVPHSYHILNRNNTIQFFKLQQANRYSVTGWDSTNNLYPIYIAGDVFSHLRGRLPTSTFNSNFYKHDLFLPLYITFNPFHFSRYRYVYMVYFTNREIYVHCHYLSSHKELQQHDLFDSSMTYFPTPLQV